METWLNNDTATAVLKETCPSYYEFYQTAQDNQNGGGIAVIYRNHLQLNMVNLGTYESFEYLACCDSSKAVIFVTIQATSTCHRGFFELISECITNYDKIIIHGDFNIHVNKSNEPKAVEFLNLLENFDLVQHIATPTHKHGNTLDLVITRGARIEKITLSNPLFSEHHCLFFEVDATVSNTAAIIQPIGDI